MEQHTQKKRERRMIALRISLRDVMRERSLGRLSLIGSISAAEMIYSARLGGLGVGMLSA